MTVTLRTADQIPGQGTHAGPQLRFEVGQVTAREIVRARVIEEVRRYNSDDQVPDRIGLIVPDPREQVLNGPRRVSRKPLDPQRQVDAALAAVKAGRVVIMFNGQQVRDIDAPLLVTPVSEARFLRLVPLAGG
jgi:hypothetical protein